MSVFRRHGFRRSSIEETAEAAGLTRQALYHHFKSKEALFRAVIERVHEAALAAGPCCGNRPKSAGKALPDIVIALAVRAAPGHRRLLRRLAACRGAVLRTPDPGRDLYQHYAALHDAQVAAAIDPPSAAKNSRSLPA